MYNKGEHTCTAQTNEGCDAEAGPLGIGRAAIDTDCDVASVARK